MKLLGVAVAVLALLAWLWWPATVAEPRAPGGGAATDASAPASVATDSPATPPPDKALEVTRLPVEQPTGPTGARVTCVWANDGEPAQAIPVRVYRMQGKAYGAPVATAATNATGVVVFADLTAGEHAFRFGRAEARSILESGVLVDTTLSLQGRTIARGIVIGASKAPVASAVVAGEIDGLPQALATTGVDGRFRVRVASHPQIWAHKEGYGPSRLHKVAGDDEELELQLEAAGGSIQGVVLDADGRPVPNATVSIAIDLGTGDAPPRRPPVLLETDGRGEFATAQVPRGPVTVYAHAPGFGFVQQDVDTTGTGTARVVLRLRRAATIHGIVLGGKNREEPKAGRLIHVHRQRDLPGLLVGMSDALTRVNAVTDSAGRYRTTVAPGRMWMILFADRSTSHMYHNVLLREGEDHEWNPDLSRPSGVIRGVLQGSDGEPLAGFHVNATRVDLIDMKQERANAETDADGRFELQELRPFSHTLAVATSEYGEVFATRTDVHPGTPPSVWRLTGLPSQCGSIVGRVLGPDGLPVADAKCRARCDGISRNSEPLQGSKDGFRIPGVLPGTWHVVGQVEGYGSFDLGRHAVAANAQVDLGAHSLLPRGAVLVRLIERGFEPANIELALAQVEGGANKTSAFTAEAGALRSPALPPGRYRLLARGENFAPIARDVTIPAGSDVVVDLETEPAVAVVIEFVPEDLDDREWQDYLTFELRDAGGKVVISHMLEVRGAPTATFTIGLVPGTYRIESSSNQCAYRKGSTEFVVPAHATGKREVSVMLEVQAR